VSESYNISDELVKKMLKNQTSDRRWRNFKFLVVVALVVCFLLLGNNVLKVLNKPVESSGSNGHVALVRLNGTIMAGADFSAEYVLPVLLDAFQDKEAKGVVLEINSGGGSPVQSSIIYERIMALKKQYNKKVVVVGEDLLASGAYMVAMGADTIYVNPNTITGSIGVIMAGFGFNEAMSTVGVERRVFTAGANKHRLDAFSPLQPQDVAKAKVILDETHQYFMAVVKRSRGDRLQGDKEEIFSGDFWTGMTAVKYGVVDGLGNLSQVIPQEFNVTEYVDYSAEKPLLKQVLSSIGAELNVHLQAGNQTRLVAAV
jgi:protease IV